MLKINVLYSFLKTNKSRLLLLCIAVLLNSCLTARYSYNINGTPYGVDYNKGIWLLNTIDAPFTIKSRLDEISKTEFYKILGDSLKCADEENSFSMPYISIKPDSLLLRHVKNISKCDFLIDIKAYKVKDELGFFEKSSSYKYENKTETVLHIYNLNSLEVIYTRTVTAVVSTNENDSNDTYFSYRY